MSVVVLLARTLAAAAAVRVCVLFGQFWRGVPGVHAYHVESAGAGFALLAALAWWAGHGGPRRDDVSTSVQSTPVLLAVFAALSLILYAPALPVGLLSDDFVLITRAHHWQLGAVASYAFRPIAMGLWALFDHAGAGTPVFHAAIVVLHGVVAFLTVRIAAAWTSSTWATWLAGALMLTFPAAVEPVVWLANGFENVTMAAFVLMAVLVSRRYGIATAVRDRVLCAALVVAAVLSKETGAVAGVLILIDAFARRRLSRALCIDAGVLTAAGVVYGAIRSMAAGDAPMHEISRYALQRTIFQTFGGLAQQWPATARSLTLPVATIAAAVLVALILAAVVAARRDTARTIVSASAWAFVSVLPVFGWLLIGPNLRDSRWLYLAEPAWAIAVAALASAPARGWMRTMSATAAVLIVLLHVVAVRWQIGAWVRAGDLRDRVLNAVNQNPDARACGAIGLSALPENVDGAYVLLNGMSEALVRTGSPVRLDPGAPAACRFHWNGVAITP